MKKFVVTAVCLLNFGLVSTLAAQQGGLRNPGAKQYLFTIIATSGSFAGDRLTLNDIPSVVFFTDRPYRKSGHLTPKAFLAAWKRDYKNAPPNAILTIHGKFRDSHAVLILSDPQLTKDGLAFKIKLLDERLPRRFEHAALFIDGFPCRVNGC